MQPHVHTPLRTALLPCPVHHITLSAAGELPCSWGPRLLLQCFAAATAQRSSAGRHRGCLKQGRG
jgi:hypothetical protein